MHSIKTRMTHENVVNKSRFIGIAVPVSSEEDIHNELERAHQDYPDASHYTYAYILGDDGHTQKASDDGEPTRTAGYPILDVLLKNGLTDILVIVVRYFGGIKLGAGGLIRAYTKAAAQVVSVSQLAEKTVVYLCQVTTNYNHLGAIDRVVREETELKNVAYDETITFTFSVDEKRLDLIRESLFQKNNFEDRLEIIDEWSMYV